MVGSEADFADLGVDAEKIRREVERSVDPERIRREVEAACARHGFRSTAARAMRTLQHLRDMRINLCPGGA